MILIRDDPDKRYTKETAFVNAVTAAGVVYSVTQACTMGVLLQCTCGRHSHNLRDQATDGQWEWGGCGDDVNFGYKKSKQFMDRRKKQADIRTKLHLHNNEAGRLAVKQYMRTVCKCHGLSGSCTLKTCWRKMPLFRSTGHRLMKRYDAAHKVTISNDGARLIPSLGWSSEQPSNQDLVYSSESPDYCTPNRKVGSQGTMGRLCNVTSGGTDRCELMCCGRGYHHETKLVHENCKCQFKWCCEVHCQTCITEKTITRCN
ncbi:hypothetical protein LSH36_1129g00040 [Paralvinella palmiformis]|uniref:Protein Wnt n=1 Tax=Paralvinella palmiformis TaxID=53620 RepID=A0AAD9MSD6_9ANNE|nr:hypothetical protein LSH36_1129g00040 [Paralvinella palmiformis]